MHRRRPRQTFQRVGSRGETVDDEGAARAIVFGESSCRTYAHLSCRSASGQAFPPLKREGSNEFIVIIWERNTKGRQKCNMQEGRPLVRQKGSRGSGIIFCFFGLRMRGYALFTPFWGISCSRWFSWRRFDFSEKPLPVSNDFTGGIGRLAPLISMRVIASFVTCEPLFEASGPNFIMT